MGRRASREVSMKLLYQLEIRKDSREEQIKSTLEEYNLKDKDVEYITDIVDGVYKNKENIDKTIENHSKGWKISRISKVDLSILRLGIYEIVFREDIPINVSINEAVELAKNYSGEESGAFVNGILGKIRKDNFLAIEEKKE
ncbi:transcription antitermination factor NusB [Herbivorax sp. ANBcel31]|uniref:transcription antitermination factor NusB n=1 Tax=Herbivorax sp. ANBcel31 TaxID=3069754 RepID=UPI0027B4D1F0|nr:transcription antitermination factor NusB [Herbivorax sp. ANBcel31]MDQ2085310.1 transcription antitermination factor NusB [Herbivorax sp. ANBcel31]